MARLSLRMRIFSLLAAILVVALAGGVTVLWHAHKTDSLLSHVQNRSFSACENAGLLTEALLEQRGQVAS